MSEPRTEAGRALLHELHGACFTAILAIEAEAATSPTSPFGPDLPVDGRLPSVEEIASALYETDPPDSWMRTGTPEYWKRAVAMLAVIARDRTALESEPEREDAVSEPRTATGRRLLADNKDLRAAILLIEDEAAALSGRRVA